MLLGSFIDPTPSEIALDIGAGTGVLTLMVLQKNPNLIVDAVEIHEDAAVECAFNVEQSPWQDRVKVHALNYLEFNPNKQYDLIFSNPPFYLDGLKSGIESIDQAKHISHEMYEHFIRKTARLLREEQALSTGENNDTCNGGKVEYPSDTDVYQMERTNHSIGVYDSINKWWVYS